MKPAARQFDFTLHAGNLIQGFPTVLINGRAAVRVLDWYVCPIAFGGVVSGPGAPTVLIGGMPAAARGDLVACAMGADFIVTGSPNVFVGVLFSWWDLFVDYIVPDWATLVIGIINPLAPLIIHLWDRPLEEALWVKSVIAWNTNLVGWLTAAVAGVYAAAGVAVAVVAVVWAAVCKVHPTRVPPGLEPGRASTDLSMMQIALDGDIVQEMDGSEYYAPVYFL